MNTAALSSLVQATNDCAAACEFCAASCLKEQDLDMMRDCIRLDLDCSDACHLLANLAGRDSRFVAEFARHIASVCDACAQECAKHDQDHCQKCAAACRRCAEACRSAGAR
jgi:hypothetical protein